MSITTTTAANIQTYDIDSKKDLLKRTICKGSTDEEFELFLMACKRTKLDPFMKQIYAVQRWSNADKRNTMTLQTSIDGFRLIADRTGNYAPGREATIAYNDKGTILSATSYVKKRTADGTWHEVASTAYYEEYVQKTKDGNPTNFWSRMPHVMLSKCAESMALRKAFPAELSGIYTTEEMPEASKEEQTLTEEQYAKLDMLLFQIEDEDYMEKLTNHLGVSTIYDIAPRDYARTIRSLEKRAGQGKEVKNETNVA